MEHTSKAQRRANAANLKQGDAGTYCGFRAAFVRHYDGSMIEIRTPGGVTCVDAGEFIPEPEFFGDPAGSEFEPRDHNDADGVQTMRDFQ